MCQSAPLRCRMRALPCQPSGGQGMGLGASCPAASSTLRAGPQAQGPPLALALASLARGLEPGPATRAAQYLVPGPWQIPVLAQARQLPVPARQPVRWSQPPWVPVRVQARPGGGAVWGAGSAGRASGLDDAGMPDMSRETGGATTTLPTKPSATTALPKSPPVRPFSRIMPPAPPDHYTIWCFP